MLGLSGYYKKEFIAIANYNPYITNIMTTEQEQSINERQGAQHKLKHKLKRIFVVGTLIVNTLLFGFLSFIFFISMMDEDYVFLHGEVIIQFLFFFTLFAINLTATGYSAHKK